MAKVIIELNLTQASIIRELAEQGVDQFHRMAISEHNALRLNREIYQAKSDALKDVLTVLA